MPLSGHSFATELPPVGHHARRCTFAAAVSGDLEEGSGVREQALRMLADPRAFETLGSFHRQLLDLEEFAM